MRTTIAALLCSLCGCADVTVLLYRPSKLSPTIATIDHGRSTLPRPARDEATAAGLSDGVPVWVVHHDDNTVSVVSAVAPARPRIQRGYARDDVAAQVDRSLVSWIPGVRRFYAGGILFDERGHALGYADADGCAGECPRIEDMPLMLRDLDTFTIMSPPGSAGVEVGQLVEGQPRGRAETWLPWRRPTKREDDMRAADSAAWPRLALVDALTVVEGHYAVVDGQTIRSTHAEPLICKSTNQPGTCGACGSDRLQLAGIGASDAAVVHSSEWWRDPREYWRERDAVYVEAESGTFLVQRSGTGFRILAGLFRGMCSGSW